MNTCRHCKWWTPPGTIPTLFYDAKHVGLGACELTRIVAGEAKHPQSKAIVASEGEWQSVLNTAPDFGRNQFERVQDDE